MSVCTVCFTFQYCNPPLMTLAAQHCTYVVLGPNNCVYVYMCARYIQDFNDRRIQYNDQRKNT